MFLVIHSRLLQQICQCGENALTFNEAHCYEGSLLVYVTLHDKLFFLEDKWRLCCFS